MKIVHVVPPPGSGGQRHEERFPDEMEETEIHILLGMRAKKYGLLKTGNGDETCFYLDHPGTVVAFGEVKNKIFTETGRVDAKDIKKLCPEIYTLEE